MFLFTPSHCQAGIRRVVYLCNKSGHKPHAQAARTMFEMASTFSSFWLLTLSVTNSKGPRNGKIVLAPDSVPSSDLRL